MPNTVTLGKACATCPGYTAHYCMAVFCCKSSAHLPPKNLLKEHLHTGPPYDNGDVDASMETPGGAFTSHQFRDIWPLGSPYGAFAHCLRCHSQSHQDDIYLVNSSNPLVKHTCAPSSHKMPNHVFAASLTPGHGNSTGQMPVMSTYQQRPNCNQHWSPQVMFPGTIPPELESQSPMQYVYNGFQHLHLSSHHSLMPSHNASATQTDLSDACRGCCKPGGEP
ncbi:hypothetical protein M758_UG050500 [Ceratodon purpureus]|nr:hypothetical protein M758_UG050500 [Ceratodon purpureus]